MTTAEYRAKLRARKAAALGMSLEQFDLHVAEEERRIAEYSRALYNRTHQWAVIATNAAYWGRAFVRLPSCLPPNAKL